MFFASVSGGLVALSLMATTAKIGTAFYVLALTVLPTLSFVGLVGGDAVRRAQSRGWRSAGKRAALRPGGGSSPGERHWRDAVFGEVEALVMRAPGDSTL